MEGRYITVLLQQKSHLKNSKTLSNKSRQSQQYSPVLRDHQICAKALRYACHSGSLTVEAAFVMPLLVIAVTFVLYLFLAVGIQMRMSDACHYVAGHMAAACIRENEPEQLGGYVWARQLFHIYEKEHGAGYRDWKEDLSNLSFINSDFSGDEIRICVSYRLKLPLSFGRWKSIPVTQQVTYKKWTGEGAAGCSQEEQKYVYVTPYGKVYHLSAGCRYLDLTVRAVKSEDVSDMRNRDGSIYYACHCVKNVSGSVYITDYGTSYHGKIDCSGLKRTVEKIPVQEAGSRQPCSFCGAKERYGQDMDSISK